MDNGKLPYISVIITAYDRIEFLLNAIKSVVNQTLDKKYYEIIVIKNFKDKVIDDYIMENNIIGIISSETSLGGKLIEALNVAKGHVISFLEDDDLFSTDKLEIVYNKFKADSNLCYYHNEHIPVNDKYDIKDIRGNGDISFNLSSISVEKSIIRINNIMKITLAIDNFMYLQALESGKKIIKGEEKLTHYMYHLGSAPELITNNINQFVNESIIRNKKVLTSLLSLKTTCSSKRGIQYINTLITSYRLSLYIYGTSEKPNGLPRYFFDSPSFQKFERIIAYLLLRIHKNFRTTIIYASFRNHKT